MQSVARSTLSKRAVLAPEVYSLAELCGLLKVSYTTGHVLAQAGTLPVTPIRIGRQYLFPKAEVHKLLGMSEQSDRDADSDNAA